MAAFKAHITQQHAAVSEAKKVEKLRITAEHKAEKARIAAENKARQAEKKVCNHFCLFHICWGPGDRKVHPGGLFGTVESLVADSCPWTPCRFADWTKRVGHYLGCKEVRPKGSALADIDGASLDTVSG